MNAAEQDALRARIRAQLTGPGGPFEIIEADVTAYFDWIPSQLLADPAR